MNFNQASFDMAYLTTPRTMTIRTKHHHEFFEDDSQHHPILIENTFEHEGFSTATMDRRALWET